MVPSFMYIGNTILCGAAGKPCSKNWDHFWCPKREHIFVIGCNNLFSSILPFLVLEIGTAVIAPTQLRGYARRAKAWKSDYLGLARLS